MNRRGLLVSSVVSCTGGRLFIVSLDGSLVHWQDSVGHISNLIKTRGLDDENWLSYVENASLVGYRNLSYDGFDLVSEAREVASGGIDHNCFGRSWPELVVEFLPMEPKKVVYVPFNEWVASAEWTTSGSSSVGVVEIAVPDPSSPDGLKTMSFRAHKNMVPDVVDLHALAPDAVNTTPQTNVTVSKSDLGTFFFLARLGLRLRVILALISRWHGSANCLEREISPGLGTRVTKTCPHRHGG
jgi:hypothetical protein